MIYFKALAVLTLKICVGILFLTACGPETRYELKAIQPSGTPKNTKSEPMYHPPISV